MVAWYDERVTGESDAVGMVDVSSVSVMSWGLFPSDGSREVTTDGEGDSTMDGVRVCL